MTNKRPAIPVLQPQREKRDLLKYPSMLTPFRGWKSVQLLASRMLPFPPQADRFDFRLGETMRRIRWRLARRCS